MNDSFLHRPRQGWSGERPATSQCERVGPAAQKGRRCDRRSSYGRLVIFYAVVSGEIEQVIEFYRTPSEAEAVLERVLRDEPDWRDRFYIEPIELVTGDLN
jgi:hypothetical protein